MEFGKIDSSELKSIDFRLSRKTETILSGKPANPSEVYVGCAKWGRREWVGKLYPKGTKEKDFLEHYIGHFNSIELNATHYRIFPAATLKSWADKARGHRFLFAPKFPNSISHFSGFDTSRAKESTDKFLESLAGLGQTLGPVFLQVSDRFSPKQRDKLFGYLAGLPNDLQLFLEVRHKDWFADAVIRKELLETLRKLKVGLVITDTAGRRDLVHMELTIPKAFVRFVGNSLHPSDYSRMDDWVRQTKSWLSNGLKEMYFFMHMHDERYSPELCVYLTEKLNKACGLKLNVPGLIKAEKPG